ncbi:hypothetical protein EJ08DRAFT_555758, partial [Tothia fuscella]
GFVPQNGGRDTLSLLFSCLLTLGLCVYSAVHLNIPPKDEPGWKTHLREFKWCMIGLFGPELVVYAAWRQWSSAWELKREINLSATLEKPSARTESMSKAETTIIQESTNRPEWSLVQGYYGTMGGFVFERNSMPEDIARNMFGRHERLTLTARGVALLVRCGHLPPITEADILDKNKADTIAKTLVCIQAGWMLVQVIGRLASGLPVTLLEVNTIGHVACALAMYLLWWYKPRQIRQPTKLEGKWVPQFCAYMFMASQISGRKHAHMPLHHSCPKDAAFGELVYDINSSFSGRPEISSSANNATSGRLYSPDIDNITENESEIDANKLRRDLSVQAIQKNDAIRERLRCENHELPHCQLCKTFRIPMEELLAPIASDWPNEQLLRRVDSLVMGAVLWSATIAYGSIHTAAWNAHFPSTVEKWLWHSSSIFVAFSGAVWVFINLVARVVPAIDALWLRFLRRQTYFITDFVIISLCVICGISYIFSRAFLVVEAFNSLRELPKSAYDTPSWTQVLPHL